MRDAPDCTQDETRALRADIYRLLARLLREPPSHELLDWLAGLDVDVSEGDLATHWAGLVEAARQATPEDLARAHFRHLVGVIQGEITPYASWYRNGELMDEALLSLRRDLRTLGIARREAVPEPEDHLAALCESMALLIEAGSGDEARFFMAHLAPWATECLADLARVDTLFYARLGELGIAFLAHERHHLEDEAVQDPVRLVEP
ncbi:molecular chaperone TorD family protein [Halomonas sp. NO4]|uniref:TorD/DmsD family molecular chaperone n=1 Tax=Halomonas sp. NO4 TaxID=2484813 RepID=UPI0013D367E9|nr:molecular chaperone TorD family protein [Halomonas sp. NO4]